MDPWACPSPGCKYRGVAAIHLLSVMSTKPEGHMSAAELSQTIEEAKRAARAAFERDTTVMQVELPVSLFEGQSVADIKERVCFRTKRLVSHAERLVVQRHDGAVVLRSPPGMVPQMPTAMLTFRWHSADVPDVMAFWALLGSWEATTRASQVHLEFPNHDVVIFKDRERRSTDEKHVPVPLPARPVAG